MKLSLLSGMGKSGVVENKQALPLQAKLQPAKLQSIDSFDGGMLKSPPVAAPAKAAVSTTASAKPKKQGFFSKLWGGIKSAAKAVGNALVGAAKAVGKAVVGAAKAVGNAVVGAAKVVGNALASAGKKVFETISSPIMYGGLKALSAIQETLGLEPKGKLLSARQIEMLRSVYGDSIDYSKVVIKEGKAGLISAANPSRAFVVGNTIYAPSGEISDSTLVHEMMHVWQYQNGGVGYMGKAVSAQLWGPTNANGGERGYYYEDDILAGKPFEKLNPEQQAQLIQDAFSARPGRKILPPTNPPGRFTIQGSGNTEVDITAYVLRAWDMVKAGKGVP